MLQESLPFMKIDTLTAKGREFPHWVIVTMKTSKDMRETLGSSWEFVRVKSSFTLEAKINLKGGKKKTIHTRKLLLGTSVPALGLQSLVPDARRSVNTMTVTLSFQSLGHQMM